VDKSPAQAKQCKSLVENGTKGHGLASNSHDIDLRKGHDPPYNILCASHRGYIQMMFSFKIYVVLLIWNLVYPLFQSFFEHATTLSYNFYQELSNNML
jgi:hypothetical protein